MLDHIAFSVNSAKYEEVVAWYVAALAPLGYAKQRDFGVACGLGPSPNEAKFWIGSKDTDSATGLHLAFRANDHETVDKFFEAATKAGGKDNGAPGIREKYHANYYAAFVIDPLG